MLSCHVIKCSHLVVFAVLLDEVLVAFNPVLADAAERLAALHSLDYVVHVVHQEQRRQRLRGQGTRVSTQHKECIWLFVYHSYVNVLYFQLSATHKWQSARRVCEPLQIKPSVFTRFDICPRIFRV